MRAFLWVDYGGLRAIQRLLVDHNRRDSDVSPSGTSTRHGWQRDPYRGESDRYLSRTFVRKPFARDYPLQRRSL
jgi:hypothetical protein